MPLSLADLDALVRRREAEARAAAAARVESILAMPDPGARMRAYAELARALGEDGDALPPGAEDRIALSLRNATDNNGRERAMAAWAVERRRLALLHTLRPVAAAGCAVAATLPFALAAWRWSWSFWDAAAAFLAPGPPLAGVALAVLAVGFLARRTAHADTLEGLGGLLVGAFAAGVVGLALALR